MSVLESIRNLSEKYPKQSEFLNKHVTYGTAGFRMKAVYLDWIIYRMGILACLRSLYQKSKFIGCMITASHNSAEDNGCKLVDPYGDMLEEKWEHYATEIVNSNDLKATLIKLCENEFKDFIINDAKQEANVVVAFDTRPSSVALCVAFKSGTEVLNAHLVNYNLLTTPQLHYMVRCLNTNGGYGQPNEEGYFNKISNAFHNIWKLIEEGNERKYESDLYVDGANGIGAPKIQILTKLLQSAKNDSSLHGIQHSELNIHLFNQSENSDDILNHMCGADYVKVQQKPPCKLPPSKTNSIHKYCSFDGDADRIVYYYLTDNGNKFHLLDGDKISTLVATQLKDLIQSSELDNELSLSIVQTAYANGSSTDFIQNILKIHASCTPTGVKHLHHEAQKFDIGVYFEANGHGTILFSEKAEKLIETKYSSLILESDKYSNEMNISELKQFLGLDKKLHSLYVLKHLKDCINQTVGDAISDMLVVELILSSRNLSVAEWDLLYTDLPSRQLKVTIKDRNAIKTTDAERRVSQPSELQTGIDSLIETLEFKSARSFVRPSGTEDVVRVYAEADTQANADQLALQVSQLVYDLAGGVGKRP